MWEFSEAPVRDGRDILLSSAPADLVTVPKTDMEMPQIMM